MLLSVLMAGRVWVGVIVLVVVVGVVEMGGSLTLIANAKGVVGKGPSSCEMRRALCRAERRTPDPPPDTCMRAFERGSGRGGLRGVLKGVDGRQSLPWWRRLRG